MKFDIKKIFSNLFAEKNLATKIFIFSILILLSLSLGGIRSFFISELYYNDIDNRLFLVSTNFAPHCLAQYLGFPMVLSYLIPFDIAQLFLAGFDIIRIKAVIAILLTIFPMSLVAGYFLYYMHNQVLNKENKLPELTNTFSYFKKGLEFFLIGFILSIPVLIINLITIKFVQSYYLNTYADSIYDDVRWVFKMLVPVIIFYSTAILTIILFLYSSVIMLPYICTLQIKSIFNFKQTFIFIFRNIKSYFKYIAFVLLFTLVLAAFIYILYFISSIVSLIISNFRFDIIGEILLFVALAIIISIALPFLFFYITIIANLQAQLAKLFLSYHSSVNDSNSQNKLICGIKPKNFAIIFLVVFVVCMIILGIKYHNTYFTNYILKNYHKSLDLYSTAFYKATNANNGIDTKKIRNAEDMFNEIKGYLPIENVCGRNDENRACFKSNYPKLNGNGEIEIFKRKFYKFKLKDGSSGAIYYNLPDCNANDSRNNIAPLNELCGSVWVDLNGDKKPNVYGIDLFQFLITKSGKLTPRGVEDDRVYSIKRHCSNKKQSGDACGAWIYYNNNMDYLKNKQ